MGVERSEHEHRPDDELGRTDRDRGTQARRTATVTTTSPSQVLVLFGIEYRRLQQESPELAARIVERVPADGLVA